MLLLNFGHPLTDAHLAEISALLGREISGVVPVNVHFDHEQPFQQQLRRALAEVPLSAHQWQTEPLLINPPSLAPITAVLLAELHGRCGYFPPILRLKPKVGAVPPQFEVAEVVNLQAIRDTARAKRSQGG